MATITIQIADKDKNLFEQLAKRLNAKIIKSEDDTSERILNATTMKAFEDARIGKVKKIENIDDFFSAL